MHTNTNIYPRLGFSAHLCHTLQFRFNLYTWKVEFLHV